MKKILTAMLCVATMAVPAVASAATSTVTRSDGYSVSVTGPDTGRVGVTSTYTATCGGAPCSVGEFRMFGGNTGRLGEGFGRGPLGSYRFTSSGLFSVRYRVGAQCIGSPRQACPIDVFLNVGVTA